LSSQMRYRAEIDGLRALAVVPVILFHAGFEPFSGGYIGVDIFFVISGYLITRLISEEIVRGQFSIATFYERRARRILPALFLVCLVSMPIGWRLLLPDEFSDLGRSVVAVTAFASNFHFWLQGDYFAAPAESWILHHTWSLAVEEQFYILFPLLLVGLSRVGRRRTFIVVLLGSLASLTLAEFGARIDPSANFYLMPTRAWELGAGALLALGAPRLEVGVAPFKHWIAAIGLAAIAISMLSFGPTTRHPGLITLAPVLGTAALIVAATPETLIGRWLSSGILVGIGLISYSAYLWHQPLFAFARIYVGVPSAAQYLALIAVTFLLARLTWRFVERPFRDRQWFIRERVLPLSIASSAVLLMIGIASGRAEHDSSRLDEERRFVAHWTRDRNPLYRACIFRPADGRTLADACIHNSSGNTKVAIVGDSHAAVIANQLARALAEAARPLIELTHVACPPAKGLVIATAKGKGCPEFNEAVGERIGREDIDTVIMLARWSQYVVATPFDNGEGVVTSWTAVASPVNADREVLADHERMKLVAGAYAEAVKALLRDGKRVVVVYPVPEVGWETPREMARRARVTLGEKRIVSTRYDIFRSRNLSTYAALDAIPESPNLIRVRPGELLCNTVLHDRCVAEMAGKPIYWDDSHLNESVGAKMLADEINRAMKVNGWL
jgi:peptidoglycan/LPS O-acetylase OafA/YrhL